MGRYLPVFAGVAAFFAVCVPASAVSLNEVVASALAHSPELGISESLVGERAGERLEAASNFLPNVTARYSETDTDTDDTETTTTATELTGSINLFNGFSDTNTLRAAWKNLTAARISREAVRQGLVRSAADQYADIKRKKAVAERYRTMRDNAETILEIAKARFAAGRIKRTELLKAEADYQQSLYELVDADREVEIALITLSSTTGATYSPDEPFDDDTVVSVDDDLASLVARAKSANPELLELSRQAEAYGALRAARWGALLPNVDVSATQGTYETDGAGEYDETRLGVTFSWQLFTGGSNTGQIISAKNRANRAAYEYTRRLHEIVEDVTRTYSGIVSNRQRLGYLERLVDVARESYDQTLIAFRLGKSDIGDVLTAEDDLIEAMIELEATRYALVSDTLRLRYLVGEEVLP